MHSWISVDFCLFCVLVKNPVYATSGNDIQLERPKGSQSVQSHAQDTQQIYQGLVFSNGKLCLFELSEMQLTVFYNNCKKTPVSSFTAFMHVHEN